MRVKIQRNRWLALFMTALGLLSCNQEDKGEKQLVIANTLAIERAELASIPYQEFLTLYKNGKESKEFKLLDDQGNEYAYQLERMGSDHVVNVLIWVKIAANSEVKLHAVAGKPAPVTAKTFARYIPERYDDFAWENDRIAFRMYGKALEGRPDDAQGLDIWAKRTEKLIVDAWYKTGDYHKDHGDGLDYYAVGMTLGAGDIAPYIANKIIYSKHYRKQEVLDNGPLRSTFRLSYEPWQVNGKEVSVTKTITLDAGSQLNRVEAVYQYEGDDKLPLVAGMVLREEGGKIIKNLSKGIAAYWEPVHGNDGTLGVAVIGQIDLPEITENEGQLLAHFSTVAGEPLVYYNGGAWDKAGMIHNANDWEKYLMSYKEKLNNPLRVSIK
ncbi:DUF4861 family protein [Olivibacter sp. CPCC 100613]|uniref:DUF4861 family protein n=1 Tax=Olivibacter sp. CPCC 100613 TaxID=3079931 RepID=UPI002FFA8653